MFQKEAKLMALVVYAPVLIGLSFISWSMFMIRADFTNVFTLIALALVTSGILMLTIAKIPNFWKLDFTGFGRAGLPAFSKTVYRNAYFVMATGLAFQYASGFL